MAPFAYAGPGIKLSNDSGASKKRLTGFSVCSAVGHRPPHDGIGNVGLEDVNCAITSL
jgi:hypothetical protein